MTGQPQASADTVIETDGLSRSFGDQVALDDVSLTVPGGTVLGVIGPSGAGKTTCLRLITGALRPTSGSVRVLGQDPVRLTPSARRRIGYMPQLLTLQPELTAGENLDLAASLFGMLWRSRRRRVKEVLDLLDLTPVRGRLARDLSGGMQRRVALGSALVHDPDLFILDEPTVGIDPLLRAQVWTELRRLRDDGRTLLVTTQYVSEAESCDLVALIAGGRLVALDTPDALRRRATGGEVIELETSGTFDAESLHDIEGVRSVRQLGLRTMRVVVEDAGRAMPLILNMIDGAGATVVNSREWRPTYDEIFAELVEQTTPEEPPLADAA
jgi:ABC-2 type transport system ATP-binding protein